MLYDSPPAIFGSPLESRGPGWPVVAFDREPAGGVRGLLLAQVTAPATLAPKPAAASPTALPSPTRPTSPATSSQPLTSDQTYNLLGRQSFNETINDLKWPVLIALVLIIYYTTIRSLLLSGRLSKISIGSWFDAEFGNVQASASVAPDDVSSAENAANTVVGQVAAPAGGASMTLAFDALSPEAQPADPNNAQSFKNAQTLLDSYFRKVFSAILLSQLRLLRSANGAPQSNDQVKAYYALARANGLQMQLETWMSFLVKYGLVMPSNEGVEITELGRAFLAWFGRQNYTDFSLISSGRGV